MSSGRDIYVCGRWRTVALKLGGNMGEGGTCKAREQQDGVWAGGICKGNIEGPVSVFLLNLISP